ncbi:natriuretic peptide C [Rhinolophus ferrumequinum]|uniref:Natriuretic peptide C n=1 Tax=Rhinolophus ferrumequinum TaxID=59479 RepID=A0A7J7YJ91_RHIFE|nr:natriuretic peptide C [Rhinolophus ferrumequinum]
MLERARELRKERSWPCPTLRAVVRKSATRLPEAVAPTSRATSRDCSGTYAWTPSLRGRGPAPCRRTPPRARKKATRRAIPRAASASNWTESAPRAAWDVSAATPGGGLGTCSVLLRSPWVIWKHLQGNVAFTFLSFPPPPRYWEYTTPAVLLLFREGGMILLFVFLKMKNKKLYIIYILYT